MVVEKLQDTTKNTSDTDVYFDENQNPLDINELGNATWGLLHTIAAYYPNEPSKTRKESTRSFLFLLAEIFPCRVCGEDWKNVLKKMPPVVESHPSFSQWLCRAHNDINIRLGKPEFPCNLVNRRWKAEMFQQEE